MDRSVNGRLMPTWIYILRSRKKPRRFQMSGSFYNGLRSECSQSTHVTQGTRGITWRNDPVPVSPSPGSVPCDHSDPMWSVHYVCLHVVTAGSVLETGLANPPCPGCNMRRSPSLCVLRVVLWVIVNSQLYYHFPLQLSDAEQLPDPVWKNSANPGLWSLTLLTNTNTNTNTGSSILMVRKFLLISLKIWLSVTS